MLQESVAFKSYNSVQQIGMHVYQCAYVLHTTHTLTRVSKYLRIQYVCIEKKINTK